MRIWSLHPKYLDTIGLVALWRETLLAKKVLEGKTVGYKKHPQLDRFKANRNPLNAVNYYLKFIWLEAEKRNFNFDKTKFAEIPAIEKIDVTKGQLSFEQNQLLEKLKIRDLKLYHQLINVSVFESHPIFKLTEGEVESWEKMKT